MAGRDARVHRPSGDVPNNRLDKFVVMIQRRISTTALQMKQKIAAKAKTAAAVPSAAVAKKAVPSAVTKKPIKIPNRIEVPWGTGPCEPVSADPALDTSKSNVKYF